MARDRETWSQTQFNRNMKTEYYRLGSYKAVAEKYGTSVSTAFRRVNAQTKGPVNEMDARVAAEAVEDYKESPDDMWEIVQNANKAGKRRKKKEYRKQVDEGTLPSATAKERIKALDEHEVSDEEFRRIYEKARDSNNPDDWRKFRPIHKARGGSP